MQLSVLSVAGLCWQRLPNKPGRGVGAITEHQKTLFEMISESPDLEQSAVSPNKADPVQQLAELKEICLKCIRCPLREGCQQVVFGDGNPQARLMLIGEGPGADEDRVGIPFVGRAGRLLDNILAASAFKREEVYIANVVKCRPPGNRAPLPAETEACLPYLEEQIKLIDPRIIICLGASATRTIMDKNAAITRYRGQWHEKGGRSYIATFHPAALLRDPGKKKDVWEDFKKVIDRYNQ